MVQSTNRYAFYKQVCTLSGDDALVDTHGRVLVRLLKQIIPEHLLATLEKSAGDAVDLLTHTNNVDDCRGIHTVVKFGSYIERGGSGKICTSKENERFQDFLSANAELWKFVTNIFTKFCPQIAQKVLQLPPAYRVFGAFSIGFWNVSDVYKLHRDERDLRWCLAIPFSNFLQAMLDFPYINTMVDAKRGDMCFFWSKKLWHNLRDSLGERQVLILTNHSALVSRYANVEDVQDL